MVTDSDRIDALESALYWISINYNGVAWTIGGAGVQASGHETLRECFDAWIKVRDEAAKMGVSGVTPT